MLRRWWPTIVVFGVSVIVTVWAVGREWGAVAVGNIGEWLAGLGTLAALAVSLFLIRQEQENRRRDADDRERRQARLVYGWVGIKTFDDANRYTLADPLYGPCFYIRNNSDEPIYDVTLQPEPYDPNANTRGALWNTILPGETREAFWRDWPDQPSDIRPTINFVDANGIAWHRDRTTLTRLGGGPDIKFVGIDRVSPPEPMHRPGD